MARYKRYSHIRRDYSMYPPIEDHGDPRAQYRFAGEGGAELGELRAHDDRGVPQHIQSARSRWDAEVLPVRGRTGRDCQAANSLKPGAQRQDDLIMSIAPFEFEILLDLPDDLGRFEQFRL